ncbi:transcriptional regulator [Actinokineospora sp. 24-640]
MTRQADQVLADVRRQVTPVPVENRMVAMVEAGQASLTSLGALAAEQHRIIRSDWRTFLMLAGQAVDPSAREFFTSVAGGEAIAAGHLLRFAAACGLSEEDLADYQPQPGAQAYPSYLAWLVVNGNPRDAQLAILTNFAEWGQYCAAISRGLREHYGMDAEATAFFDFFAEPAPELDRVGLAALQEALDAKWDPQPAVVLARLLHGYELMFWHTLADLNAPAEG